MPLILVLGKSAMLLHPLLALAILGSMRLPPLFRGLYQKKFLRHACGDCSKLHSHIFNGFTAAKLSCLTFLELGKLSKFQYRTRRRMGSGQADSPEQGQCG